MKEPKVILVPDGNLRHLETRPNIFAYSKSLWDRRDFIKADASSKAMNKGRDTFLGKLWIVLDPLFQVGLYAIIFGVVLGVSRGMDNFVGFLTIGVIFFRLCTRGFATGIGAIQKSKALISSFQFPRAAVPISITLKEFLDALAPAGVAVAMALLLQIDKGIPWTIILVIPILLLISLFCLGICLFVARATAFVPDLRTPINLINRGLFFVSGVFFSLERFQNHPALEAVMRANPVYQYLTAVRTCVLDGQVPSVGVWAYLCLWSFGLCILGYIYFWQAEDRYSSVK